VSRNAFVSIAVGLLVVASALHMGATDNPGSALRAVVGHLLWATTLSGGHTLQRRDS
jgi:hypothetical protein